LNKFTFIYDILNLNTYDILFFQESKIDSEIPDQFFANIFYNIIRRDRFAGGGGLIIFIKKNISFSNLIIDDKFETISFVLNLHCKSIINFIYSYNPHYNYTPSFIDHLESVISRTKLMNKTIILGDFNNDLLSSKGDALNSFLETFGFKNFVNSATHFNKHSNTLLDVVYSNFEILNNSVVPCPFSDHACILTSLNFNSSISKLQPILSRCLNSTKLSIVKNSIRSIPFQILDLFDNVNTKWFYFKKLILDLIDELAPIKELRPRTSNLPWVDAELRSSFNYRDKLFSLAVSSGSSRESPEWSDFRTARNSSRQLLRLKMKDFFMDKTQSNFSSSKKYWSFYKSFVKTKHSNSSLSVSSLTYENRVYSEPLEIASIFNKHLSNLSVANKFSTSECLALIDRNLSVRIRFLLGSLVFLQLVKLKC
jgi:hypothetical protein